MTRLWGSILGPSMRVCQSQPKKRKGRSGYEYTPSTIRRRPEYDFILFLSSAGFKKSFFFLFINKSFIDLLVGEKHGLH